MIFDWHQEARVEFDDATDYYEGQFEGLGDRFITHIEAATARIAANPSMSRCFYRECRRVKAEKFLDLIIYRAKGESLQIIA